LLNKNPSKRFIAGNGGNSHKNRILGESGEDLIIPVPIGVTVLNDFSRVLGKNRNLIHKGWFKFMERRFMLLLFNNLLWGKVSYYGVTRPGYFLSWPYNSNNLQYKLFTV
jgi:hypothetical protein